MSRPEGIDEDVLSTARSVIANQREDEWLGGILARALQSERDRSASTITALREEVERMRTVPDPRFAELLEKFEELRSKHVAAEAQLTALRERAETAEREVERLRRLAARHSDLPLSALTGETK